jgi:hypothetical protein
MAAPISSVSSISSAWEVFMLFSIPIGGGIPAGVVLAKKRGITWLSMLVLYFISDVLLALVFEPLMLLVTLASKHNRYLARIRDAFKKSTSKTISKYGINPGPISLILLAFGVDPMTGRTAAFAAGHGFFSGWALAIAGDMIFFVILMASTLWLNSFLGDGTWTAVIIMVAMTVVPLLIRRVRGWWRSGF